MGRLIPHTTHKIVKNQKFQEKIKETVGSSNHQLPFCPDSFLHRLLYSRSAVDPYPLFTAKSLIGPHAFNT
jgi:hypothetical protein